MQWCIAKNGGGYTQTGVTKGLKVPCLFMITEVSIRCQKNPEVGIRRIPAYTPPPIHHCSYAMFLFSLYIIACKRMLTRSNYVNMSAARCACVSGEWCLVETCLGALSSHGLTVRAYT